MPQNRIPVPLNSLSSSKCRLPFGLWPLSAGWQWLVVLGAFYDAETGTDSR